MSVIYTAETIEGITEHSHPPVNTRVANEKLTAFIDEHLLKNDLIASYTLADDREFPFPDEKPDILEMKDFFGSTSDLNHIEAEVDALYQEPRDERESHKQQFEQRVSNASAEELIEIFREYHYTNETGQERYLEARETVEEEWEDYSDRKSDLLTADFSKDRGGLAKALSLLNHPQLRSFYDDLTSMRGSVGAGHRQKAEEELKRLYRDWKRKPENITPLYNQCAMDRFYGAGFWIARLELPDEVDEWRTRQFDSAEEALEQQGKPYRVVDV